jgi:PhzF family phenazine biosynthesis protein
MPALPYAVVDAFTTRPFGGNPAAVFQLDAWLDDALLQQIAAEMALSETAFVVAMDDGFRLRWMTPTTEVDLCGHATLAAASVLAREAVRFHTRSGVLTVTRRAGAAGDRYVVDLPAQAPEWLDQPALLDQTARALGAAPEELLRTRNQGGGQVTQATQNPAAGGLVPTRNLLAVFEDAATVRALTPDFRRVHALPAEGVIATAPGAPGDSVDFVSRYFTPQHGIDEDPVTGSAHCTLGPYWARRLRRTTLQARQVSRRGGELEVEVAGDRVYLTGNAVLVARGELLLP